MRKIYIPKPMSEIGFNFEKWDQYQAPTIESKTVHSIEFHFSIAVTSTSNTVLSVSTPGSLLGADVWFFDETDFATEEITLGQGPRTQYHGMTGVGEYSEDSTIMNSVEGNSYFYWEKIGNLSAVDFRILRFPEPQDQDTYDFYSNWHSYALGNISKSFANDGTAIQGVRDDNQVNQLERLVVDDGPQISFAIVPIEGTSGKDTLIGTPDADILLGYEGNDTLRPYEGADIVDGGSGTDWVQYIWEDTSVVIDLAAGTVDEDNDGITDDTLISIEKVSGSAYDDTILGGAGADNLNGINGDDLVRGAGGNDLIYGGNQNDALYGEEGNDTIRGESGNDALHGGAGVDFLVAGRDNDTLYGGDGNDTLKGDDGNDVMLGDAGKDTLRGGNGYDTAEYEATSDGFIIWRDANYHYVRDTNVTGVETDTLFSDTEAVKFADVTLDLATLNLAIGDVWGTPIPIIGTCEDDDLRGTEGRDDITGGSGDDELQGFASADTLRGDDGSDTLWGGDGGDSLYGGSGNDTLHSQDGDDEAYGGAGNDRVEGDEGNDTLYGDSGDDDLRGLFGNDVLYGGDGRDFLNGWDGNDTLIGGAGYDDLTGGDGNDRLSGGETYDWLRGGAGADTFLFDSTAFSGVDLVWDFSVPEGDVLELASILIGFNPNVDQITDFVSLTQSGLDMILAVDRDGTGAAYISEDIASLEVTSGLDAQTLYWAGDLLIT